MGVHERGDSFVDDPRALREHDRVVVSVVVPVRNGERFLSNQLDALEHQTFAACWELLLVDNGSTDDTVALAADYADRLPLRVIDAHHRPGINYARNRGLASAAGDFVLFCDHDDVVASDWIEEMYAAAATADIVGGRLEEETLNTTADARRPRLPTATLPLALDFLPFAVGANMGVWRKFALDLGGFDESYEGGYDDADMSLRAQLAGGRLVYAPDAVVAYRHRNDYVGLFQQFRKYGRAEPLLYRRFAHAGLARPSAMAVIRRWGGLLVHSRKALVDATARSRWAYTAGYSVGRVEGSLRHRKLFL